MPTLNIEQLAHQLGKARRNGDGWVCCCPAHDDSSPSLSLAWDQRDQKLLAFCHGGCSFEDILTAIKSGGMSLPKNIETEYQHPFFLTASRQDMARQLWQSTEPAENSVVEIYLRARGYMGPMPATLRYCKSHYHSPSKQNYPCMVARINTWPCTDICAMHRTYLREDGLVKASIEPNKMILGKAKGGAVQLAPPGKTLVIAEGIETALSVYESTQLPTWAGLSSTLMVHVEFPPLEITQEIIIAADGDQAGLGAAYKLAKRLLPKGYTVKIATAPKGLDFNDVLRRTQCL